MLIVGPYEFSIEDARNTLLSAPKILSHMAEDRPRAIDHLQTYLAKLLDGHDPATMDEPSLAAILPSVWAVITAATPTIRAVGLIPSAPAGSVRQLNISRGGVPKTAVESAYVGWKGVEGDRQATRKHHGRPFQALSLWSTEVMETLRAEGHQVVPGAAGENITVSGLPWNLVRPGTRLRIGEVVCDVTTYAVPCKQLATLFVERDFDRIHHDRDLANGTASCRVYATVVERGIIAAGDAVVLEP